jgi:hypothetical protein
VLIWDIDLKLAHDPPRNLRTTDDPLTPGTSEAPGAIPDCVICGHRAAANLLGGSKACPGANAWTCNRFRFAAGNAHIRERSARQLVRVTRLGKRRSNSERH